MKITLNTHAIGGMLGMRGSATAIRKQIQDALNADDEVIIDFSGVEVTQGFFDELLGLIVLEKGPSVMTRVVLKACSEQTRGIIRFVVLDRAAQHSSRRTDETTI